jgi:hypothetical protein
VWSISPLASCNWCCALASAGPRGCCEDCVRQARGVVAGITAVRAAAVSAAADSNVLLSSSLLSGSCTAMQVSAH